MYRGKRVSLRPFEWEDAEKYRQWINDPELLSLVDRVLPVTAEEHRRWYETMVGDPCSVVFAIDALSGHRFVGCIWLYDIDYRHRHAEVRIVIGDKEYWGKGIGQEAISILLQFAFKQLNLHKLYAYVLATNVRALGVFEKSGFVREGVLKQERYIDGAYVDVVRLASVRKD
jgi:RimJ/RimL family protein N-acetyltransferase